MAATPLHSVCRRLPAASGGEGPTPSLKTEDDEVKNSLQLGSCTDCTHLHLRCIHSTPAGNAAVNNAARPGPGGGDGGGVL